MQLGVVADDLTGATDVALMLQRAGMRTVQIIGVSHDADPFPEADAVVVALKSRTIAAGEAVAQSLSSVRALKAAGARQILFKYCSTFDSTDTGNIGPVAAALADELGATSVVFCPAFPANGRAVFQGHLFVGRELLSDSPMRDHPLTPMRDANLVRVLSRQTTVPVGLVAYDVVSKGAGAMRDAMSAEARAGRRFVVVDAVSNQHLITLGKALAGAPFVTGGSGIAMGLPQNFGFAAGTAGSHRMSVAAGRALVLAGSCSAATRRQVAAFERAGLPSRRIDPLRAAEQGPNVEATAAIGWLAGLDRNRPALLYATAEPAAVAAVQAKLGVEQAGHVVEAVFAAIAVAAVDQGTTRLLVAGGETSGAVVQALGIRALGIGPEIAPGVPWTAALGGRSLALALKSGNFGADDMFLTAWELLE
jgi:uncharacterized protein YgbK (DUF1537 family)